MITTENKTQTNYEKLTDLIDDYTGIYLPDYITEDDIEYEGIAVAEDLFETLQDQGAFNIDIIYYHKAIEYLRDNDSSLTESLEIATELGYTTENLNSEILASLLASNKAMSNYWDIGPEIDELL